MNLRESAPFSGARAPLEGLAAGLHVLDELHRRYTKDGVTLILSGLHRQPEAALKRSGLWDTFGPENIHTNIDAALERARELAAPAS